jgi:uncharacterized protein (UPF0216 family)
MAIAMTHPPRITDESVLIRWITMEVGKINEGIVKERKSLSVLLEEDTPSATTKRGEPYYFKKEVIALLGKRLPRELHARLNLPILFFLTPDVTDSCLCTDETGIRALQVLGEISELRIFHDGKCWVARAIAYAIMCKYPKRYKSFWGPEGAGAKRRCFCLSPSVPVL